MVPSSAQEPRCNHDGCFAACIPELFGARRWPLRASTGLSLTVLLSFHYSCSAWCLGAPYKEWQAPAIIKKDCFPAVGCGRVLTE